MAAVILIESGGSAVMFYEERGSEEDIGTDGRWRQSGHQTCRSVV